MSKQQRTGMKKPRSARQQRRYELGNYRIVTDTDETEKLYFEGLRDALPPDLKGKIEIVVEKKVSTSKLIEKAASIIGDFRDTWIVFDRDKVPGFDAMIEEAVRQDINVAWSNPCIEIWFLAYYGLMPDGLTSVQCCEKFEKIFKEKTNQKYNKNDKGIYSKLVNTGNEEDALKIARDKYKKWERDCPTTGYVPPSGRNACTLMFDLVGEIRSK